MDILQTVVVSHWWLAEDWMRVLIKVLSLFGHEANAIIRMHSLLPSAIILQIIVIGLALDLLCEGTYQSKVSLGPLPLSILSSR